MECIKLETIHRKVGRCWFKRLIFLIINRSLKRAARTVRRSYFTHQKPHKSKTMKICFETNFPISRFFFELFRYASSLHILPFIITVLDTLIPSANRAASHCYLGGFSRFTAILIIISSSIAAALMIPSCTLTHTYWVIWWRARNANMPVSRSLSNFSQQKRLFAPCSVFIDSYEWESIFFSSSLHSLS